jgi:hypothetical protein
VEYSVIVKGPNGPMKKAIQDRLTSISRIEEGSNNPLEIGIGVEARDLSILRNGQQQRTSSPCIFVRDVVTDIEDVFWSDGLFHSIIRDAISGKPIPVYPPEPRYWLPVQDVANAIRAMVVRNLFPCSDDPIQMAGRRPWKNGALHSEALHLWKRFRASTMGIHTPETLSEPPIHISTLPAVTERPDLSGLNDLMIACEEPNGWRPSGSLRLSIMRVLATLT